MVKAPRNGHPWSSEELDRLRNLARQNLNLADIARALERTALGVKAKAMQRGIQIAAASRRRKPAGSKSKQGDPAPSDKHP